jgi:hypothetical protein
MTRHLRAVPTAPSDGDDRLAVTLSVAELRGLITEAVADELAKLTPSSSEPLTLSGAQLGMKIPRFRGHPRWRENAPGVDHGQEEEEATAATSIHA